MDFITLTEIMKEKILQNPNVFISERGKGRILLMDEKLNPLIRISSTQLTAFIHNGYFAKDKEKNIFKPNLSKWNALQY